jgi:cell division septation protein DedD
MARRTRSAGLSLGQVLTLTLGFLVASLLIFVFGIWVGKDLVERRLAQEERIVRKPADRTAVEAPSEVNAPEAPKAAVPVAPAVPVNAVPSETPFMKLRATPTATPGKAAATSAPGKPTLAPAKPTAAPPAKAEKRSPQEWADAGWTVQVYATTDPNQATALARRLLAKGYDAYTLQAPMRGQTWYRVRVGRFPNHERAQEMEQRLKNLEGLEAAYVTSQ